MSHFRLWAQNFPSARQDKNYYENHENCTGESKLWKLAILKGHDRKQ